MTCPCRRQPPKPLDGIKQQYCRGKEAHELAEGPFALDDVGTGIDHNRQEPESGNDVDHRRHRGDAGLDPDREAQRLPRRLAEPGELVFVDLVELDRPDPVKDLVKPEQRSAPWITAEFIEIFFRNFWNRMTGRLMSGTPTSASNVHCQSISRAVTNSEITATESLTHGASIPDHEPRIARVSPFTLAISWPGGLDSKKAGSEAENVPHHRVLQVVQHASPDGHHDDTLDETGESPDCKQQENSTSDIEKPALIGPGPATSSKTNWIV